VLNSAAPAPGLEATAHLLDRIRQLAPLEAAKLIAQPPSGLLPPRKIGRLVFVETIPLGPAQTGGDSTGVALRMPNEVLPEPLDPPWDPIPEHADAAGIDLSALPSLQQSVARVDGHVKLVQALLNAANVAPPLKVDGMLG